MNRITQQTWDQLVTEGLAIIGLGITIGNQLGVWSIGNDAAQSIIEALTLIMAFVATLIYGVNSTPNRVVTEQLARHESLAYHEGMASAMSREDHGGI